MFTRLVAVAFGCAILSACVSMPTDRSDGIAINRVVERVKCELGQALAHNPDLKSWAGSVTLTLEVDSTGSVAPGATLIGPFGAGAYALDVSAGVTAKSLQTSLVTIYFPIYELVTFAERCPLSPQNQLEDSLGLTAWVDRTFDLRNEGGQFKSEDKAIGYTLEFDLEVSGGITPGFTFTRVTAKGGLTASRKTLNTLAIALFDAHLIPPAHDRPVAQANPANSVSTRRNKFGPRKSSATLPKMRAPIVQFQRGLSVEDKLSLDLITRQLQSNSVRLRF